MAALQKKVGPKTQRSLRYHAKTAFSTRYPGGDFENSNYLLRTKETGLDSAMNVAPQCLPSYSDHVKRYSRQDDSDYVYESDSDSGVEEANPRVQSKKELPSTTLSPASLQLINELKSACGEEISTSCAAKSPDQAIFVSACNLACANPSLAASAKGFLDHLSVPTTDLITPFKTSALSGSPIHWHPHLHSNEDCRRGRQYSTRLNKNQKLPCIDLQVLEGALQRMCSGKSWPYDKVILDEFHATNGKYEYDVVHN